MTSHETSVPGISHPTVVPANVDRRQIAESSTGSSVDQEDACPRCGCDLDTDH